MSAPGDQAITCAEAGRRGGEATLARHGPSFFAAIAAAQPPRPAAYYRALGAKGGAATTARYADSEMARDRSRKGGETTRDRHGTEQYRAMARLSWARRREREA